ncbi:MAG: TIGR03960 family B12-binding radical SAM protein [Armatimonadota bacterium]
MLQILDTILPRVTKPARYTGGEWNSVSKDHGSVGVKFALAFPDTYEIGMSNLGLRILYHILNKREDTVAERVFAPWVDMEAEMRQHGLSLFALESRRPVREFDILGFSLGYELSYTNVLNMLDLAGIPLRSAERSKSDPLVIAGGCCALNPEPMTPFIDAFVVGEGEEVIHEIVDAVKGSDRTTRLAALAKIPGVYVPSLYSVEYNPDGAVREVLGPKVQKRVVADLDAAEYPDRPVVPFIETVHDRATLEVMRGCTRGCRFCQAGMIYRPLRERSADALMRMAETICASTGYEEISLMSLSTADYRGIEDLVHSLIAKYEPEKIGISLPSIRADAPCVELAGEIQKVRKSGLTLAPEAGTQRLRDVINKNVTEEDLLSAVEAAFRLGWRRVKLYFMIGLPTETDEDVAAIADLSTKVAQVARQMRIRPTVGVSVSTFVPKPHTPFQWRAQDSLAEIERKQEILRRTVRSRDISLSWHDARTSRLEAVLSRGDRRLAEGIFTAWKSGCRFDAWDEHFDYNKWMDSLAEAGLDPAFYANRERPYDEVLPWDHIDCGVDKRYLEREDRAEGTTPDCRVQCAGCGLEVRGAACTLNTP